jgi:hypothetical protein
MNVNRKEESNGDREREVSRRAAQKEDETPVFKTRGNEGKQCGKQHLLK